MPPLLTSIIAFAKDKDGGLLFAPTAHHFIELLNIVVEFDPTAVIEMAKGVVLASSRSNYHLDQLAVNEVTQLISRVITEYRHQFQSDTPLENL